MPKKFFTLVEASKKLGVTRQALHEAIADKRLIATTRKIKKTIVKTISVIVVSESDLLKYKETISRSHQARGKKN